jgi:hypothetical protein
MTALIASGVPAEGISTTRQAEADLSIPNQLGQAKGWCARQGHQLVREYIEAGASGTDETRPTFSEMLADAKAQPRPFDVIVVHNFSRFARDNLTYAIAKQGPKKAGIAIQSISQPLNDDPTGLPVAATLPAPAGLTADLERAAVVVAAYRLARAARTSRSTGPDPCRFTPGSMAAARAATSARWRPTILAS